MPFSNKKRFSQISCSKQVTPNPSNISSLTQQEIACIPLILLDQIRDYRIAETFTPPKIEVDPNDPNKANILCKNLQPFESFQKSNKECCFKICPEENTLTTVPTQNGGCISGLNLQFTNNCPQTESEAREILAEYNKNFNLRIGEIFNVPKLNQSQRKLVRQNKYLSTLLKQAVFQKNNQVGDAYIGIAQSTRGCGD